jgi:hypothetical protein
MVHRKIAKYAEKHKHYKFYYDKFTNIKDSIDIYYQLKYNYIYKANITFVLYDKDTHRKNIITCSKILSTMHDNIEISNMDTESMLSLDEAILPTISYYLTDEDSYVDFRINCAYLNLYRSILYISVGITRFLI